MDATFRKIDLQSPADLAHIEAKVRRAAQQKIDRALPPGAAPEGEEDALRRRVEELVEEYIRTTFDGVRANISINGMDVKDAVQPQEQVEAYEPLDHRLADRLRALEATKESLTEKVADLRRAGPGRVARDYEAQFLAHRARVDEQIGAAAETVGESAATLAIAGPERAEEVQAMWERGTGGLVRLKGSLTETVARVERAEKVGEYVVGLEREGE